jgi:hypothetical protein
MSGSGGSCMMRNDVVTSSGAVSDQLAQRRRTRSACCQSQASMPP